MASVYGKRKILYISWFDWSLNKTKNRSTKLSDTPENRKKVIKLAEDLQSQLDEKKEEFEMNNLVKGATIKRAFDHFKRINSMNDPKTIKDYDRFYKLFKQSFDENSPCTVINKNSAEDWIISIRMMKKAQNTIFGYFKQFRHFYNFLFEEKYTPIFKLNKSVVPRAEVKDIIVFSDDDLKKIFSGLKEKNLNFKAMIYIAYYSGLRSSDMLSLSVEKTNLEKEEFNYYAKKIKKPRQVRFHKALHNILEQLIKKRKSGLLLDYGNVVNMNRAFNRYLVALGLDKKGYSMRTFRKTFITNASMKIDLATVSKLVGHLQINTTAKYYTKIDQQRQKDQLDKLEEIEGAE
jgi:integrase